MSLLNELRLVWADRQCSPPNGSFDVAGVDKIIADLSQDIKSGTNNPQVWLDALTLYKELIEEWIEEVQENIEVFENDLATFIEVERKELP